VRSASFAPIARWKETLTAACEIGALHVWMVAGSARRPRPAATAARTSR
jgi:hypothetical protein